MMHPLTQQVGFFAYPQDNCWKFYSIHMQPPSRMQGLQQLKVMHAEGNVIYFGKYFACFV